MRQVWVVDDDRAIRWVLEKALARAGIACRIFSSADDVLAAFGAEIPQVLVSDIRMPGTNGVELLARVKAEHPELPVIIMTAFSDLESAVSSFQKGAFEYLPKPFDIDKAVGVIRRALAEAQGGGEKGVPEMSGLLGSAPAMQEVFRAIGKLSGSVATVLVTGESGSGKGVVAKAIHENSPRAAAPFVTVNMADVPGDLLEGELFGYEPGAFPGAEKASVGKLGEAAGGTLFLDEVGDTPLETQAKLLRAVSEGVYYRMGGHEPVALDVRLVAATHRDLDAAVRAGTFREDLYHRLNAIRLRLPPLRDRPEDIPVLASHFLAAGAKEFGVEAKRLDADVVSFLQSFRFPGNIRQLENLCRWLTVMAPARRVRMADLPSELLADDGPAELGDGPRSGWLGALRQEVERRLGAGEPRLMDSLTRQFEEVVLEVALQHTGGKKAEAALCLGLGRNTVTRKLQEFRIGK